MHVIDECAFPPRLTKNTPLARWISRISSSVAMSGSSEKLDAAIVGEPNPPLCHVATAGDDASSATSTGPASSSEQFQGTSPAPGQEILDRFWQGPEDEYLGSAVVNADTADPGEEQDAYNVDRVNVDVWALGEEVAAEMLEAMARKPGHGLNEVLKHGFTFNGTTALEHELWNASFRLKRSAAEIRRAGSLGRPGGEDRVRGSG
jgi:hypothetical protein